MSNNQSIESIFATFKEAQQLNEMADRPELWGWESMYNADGKTNCLYNVRYPHSEHHGYYGPCNCGNSVSIPGAIDRRAINNCHYGPRKEDHDKSSE